MEANKADQYRQFFYDLRGKLLTGQVTQEYAEQEAAPVIEKMNIEAKAIAKRNGKRFKGFSFASLIR
jgi:hypothetical protein